MRREPGYLLSASPGDQKWISRVLYRAFCAPFCFTPAKIGFHRSLRLSNRNWTLSNYGQRQYSNRELTRKHDNVTPNLHQFLSRIPKICSSAQLARFHAGGKKRPHADKLYIRKGRPCVSLIRWSSMNSEHIDCNTQKSGESSLL